MALIFSGLWPKKEILVLHCAGGGAPRVFGPCICCDSPQKVSIVRTTVQVARSLCQLRWTRNSAGCLRADLGLPLDLCCRDAFLPPPRLDPPRGVAASSAMKAVGRGAAAAPFGSFGSTMARTRRGLLSGPSSTEMRT